MMTAKERARIAMEGGKPDGLPTMEIVFELERELTGRAYVLGKDLEPLRGSERERALNENAELYIRCARELGYSSITVHPAPTPWYIPGNNYYPTLEDELHVVRRIFREAGDELYVAAGIDGTYAIPDGSGFEAFVWALADQPGEMKREARSRAEWAAEQMKRLIDAGAEIMYCCSDYCFNQGPFLSPAMFEEFIFPYLAYQTEELKKAGAYVIKHTDGNILPILEMLIAAGPHVLHSIDPVAGMSMREVRKKADGRIALMGNVDSTKLQTGDIPGIMESCRAAVEGSEAGGTVFSTCNSVFSGIGLEHYRVMLDFWKQHNKGAKQ